MSEFGAIALQPNKAKTPALNPRKNTRVLISIPMRLLAELDQQAQAESRSRSEAVRHAVREYLRRSQAQ